ncbi:hypothetical protein [Silvanigrella aquatica]|uniref:Uncharacterized protein n=1 Tax=Silvanigrella aquatica TaxID=1915309 RepID=A0A1L4CZY0_9BACT|nr:hypothetical protein [Silvanigrella aquatica]APJ03487.1 hypothetical protein AXG55_06030 [Silvanigrella aquatica]
MNKRLLSTLPLFLIPIQNLYGINIHDLENNTSQEWQQTFDKKPEVSSDQGSIAKEKWNKFQIVITNFLKYKETSEKINLNLKSNLIKNYFAPLQKIILQYHASLILLEETDKKYFYNAYQGKSAEIVFNETMQNIEPLLIQLINQSFYSVLSIYAQQNHHLFQSIQFNSWIKAYWPTLNSEHRAGFEPSHYYLNSTQSLFDEELFNSFIELGDESHYDFKQTESIFEEYWNNANIKPSIIWNNKTQYYKFKYNNNSDLIDLYLKINEIPRSQYIDFIKTQKTLSEVRNSSIDFYQNILEKIEKMDRNIDNKKNKNQYLSFQNSGIKSSKIQSKSLNKCISISKNRLLRINIDYDYVNGISLKATPCIFKDKSQDWIFIKEKSNSAEFKIYSALYTGYCIDDSNLYGKSITKCHPKNQSQIWYLNSNENVLINKLTNSILKIDNLDENQNWQSNNYLVNKQNLILSSLIHGSEIYSSKDWQKTEVMLPEIANAIYISLFINQYHLENKSNWFFNKVIKMNWFDNLTSVSQKTLVKLSKYKYSNISNYEIQELLNELKNSSKGITNVQKFKISLLGIKISNLKNKYIYSIESSHLNLQNEFSQFYKSQFISQTQDQNNITTKSLIPVATVPLINEPPYYEDTYFRIKDFFDIVEKNDGKLTNLNNNRIPTYREVWDKWIEGEWDPSPEFEQIHQDISNLKQEIPESDFDNVFRMAEDSRVFETLKNQGSPLRISDEASSSDYNAFPAEEMSLGDDSAIAADLNEFEEMAEIVEMINDLEILVNNVHISIQTASEIATTTTSIESIVIGALLPELG